MLPRLYWLLAFMCSLPFPAFAQNLPLSTKGRWIVDADDNRFRLKSVNWYGASLETEVVAGLDVQPLPEIVKLIKSWGFNSIRLPFSNAMLHRGNAVDRKLVLANPQLMGKTALEVFDAVIDELTEQGVLVILNNHSTSSEWCCSYDNNGLWFFEGGSGPQTTSDWEKDWLDLVLRYKANPRVVGVDLRNEVRTQKYKGGLLPEFPNWGKGDAHDWAKAAEDLGRKVLDVNPDLLIVVEAINWEGMVPVLGSGNRPFLRSVPESPVHFQVPNKLVYAVHSYGYIGPQHNGDDKTSKGKIRYNQMDEATLLKQWREEWSFVLDAQQHYTSPIWISEFGAPTVLPGAGDQIWFHALSRFIADNDMDFAYWPLNHEAYGLVDKTWTRKLNNDWRAADFERILGESPLRKIVDATSYSSLDIRTADDNQSRSNEDWLAGARKATCPDAFRLVGISQDNRGLCVHDQAALGSEIRVESVKEFYSSPGFDWAPGLTKYLCPEGFTAAGISKHMWGTSGLLCRESEGSAYEGCHAISAEGQDQRLSVAGGEFAKNSYKMQCGDDEDLAGIAQTNGSVKKALCCPRVRN